MSVKNEFRSNGWILVKNVFSKEDIVQLREKVKQSLDNKQSGKDLLSNPYLSEVVHNAKIINVLNDILGSKPVYFGDGGFQVASDLGRISHGFHKDSAERKDPKSRDYDEDYSVVRVGIYLQDHLNHSEGLIVRTGSHKTPDLTKGKKVNVPQEAGDVIIWYLTTSHSGNAMRLKFTDYVVADDNTGSFQSLLYYRIKRFAGFMVKKGQKDRMALFSTYGTNDDHLKRYLDYLKKRDYALEGWKKSVYTSEILSKINHDKLEVIDMQKELYENKVV